MVNNSLLKDTKFCDETKGCIENLPQRVTMILMLGEFLRGNAETYKEGGKGKSCNEKGERAIFMGRMG